ncbi:D-alanine--D-alanine ligase [Desulfitispora alkaliphila]|uniref:D-alanine--D-alanine ligase n=1 Tax=Desulfitispora alkaliphila TaxID=622674 RepID=UPI003D20794B
MNLALVFGGKSGEHRVSIISAASIIQFLDQDKYNVIPVYVTNEGEWLGPIDPRELLESEDKTLVGRGKQITFLPIPSIQGLKVIDTGETIPIDVIFPIIHGTYGEDGTIQGLFELADIPYVGGGVMASAVGMDKLAMKAVYANNGLPQTKYVALKRSQVHQDEKLEQVITEIETKLGYPCFVKPANLGSSVGINKAKNKSELEKALIEAALYDSKILVEEFVDVREVEISVLGNEDLSVSVPGEIVPGNEFYDYNAKYIDNNSKLIIPAELDEEVLAKLSNLAVKSYQAIDCKGLARVDFFITKDDGRVLINEINTLPGFTNVSMYPKLWEASGLPYKELLDRVVQLAQQEYAEKKKNKVVY